MIGAHYFSEQNSLKAYSFIPLANWHKLINVILLIMQCSIVLWQGKVSGSLSRDLTDTLFGVNLIMILILQEKD